MKTLNELFDEVRDLDPANPVCMDKVNEYLDELTEESDLFMEMLLQKLDNAVISWRQPWYQGSCIHTVPLKDPDQKYEGSFAIGRITQDETDRIDKNWRKLRKKFGLPDKLECFARWKRRKGLKNNTHLRVFIISYLARGLERTLPQVYKHVVNHYGRPRRGVYSKDDQKIVDICLHHNPKQAPTILMDVLAREPRRIYYRLHDAVNGRPEKKRIRWNIALATKLIKLLLQSTGENVTGLKNKKLGINVWRQLEGEFETQGEYLRHFWYTTLHCQLFCKCDVTLRRVRRKVFKILRRRTYRVWTDINWKDVVAEFPDGFTYQFIYRVTIRIFRNDRIHINLPVHELVKVGLSKTNNTVRSNKRLKTLAYDEDGNIELIRYDVKF